MAGNESKENVTPDFLHSILDHLAHPVFVKDRAFRFVLVNDALCALMGKSREAILGTTDYDHFPASEADFFREKDEALFASGERVVIEEEPLTDSAGQVLTLSTTKVPYRDDAGEVTLLVGIIQDMTARKKADDELREARGAAEKATRAKSAFLAHVSHEIRTPMHGIMGMTQLLESGHLDAEQKEYVATIHRSTQALMNMLNDILDVSKIEAGHFELDQGKIDTEELIFEVLELMAERSAAKKIELLGIIPADFPRTLVGDASRLRQVLLNLVNNAVKFTSTGEVCVSVHRVADAPEEDLIRFDVADTGRGVKPGEEDTLFDAYMRSAPNAEGGTGLGLNICRQIIEAMGGRIWASSRNPRGAVFSFELPLKTFEESRPKPAPKPGSSGGAMVVVTHDLTRSDLAEQLTRLGHAVAAYPNLEAIPSVAVTTGSGPQIIVMDEAVMKTAQDWERLPPSWASANARLVLAPFGRPLGAAIPNHWKRLFRPLRPSRLRQVVEAHGGQGKSRPRPFTPLAKEATLGRILLVEDNPVAQRVGQLLLRKMGYQVITAADGQSALQEFAQQRFDVVLMDYHLPDMDGLEVTRRIRTSPNGETRVPIIALTASTTAIDRQRCLEAGMDDFLGKPIEWTALEARLARWVRPPPAGE
jgi:two-component system sensor histidine kinase/response regulator